MTAHEAIETFPCFGGTVTVIVTGAGPAGGAAAGARLARTRLLEWHQQFSRFEPDSELAMLNADPRETVGVSPVSVTVGSAHTIREAARRMIEGGTGAAVVIDADMPAPAIVTERDVLRCVGDGGDPDHELVGEHFTTDIVYAAPDWSLERAAEQMTAGGFRHVIVLDGSEVVGILSMRDVVARWVSDGVAAGPVIAA